MIPWLQRNVAVTYDATEDTISKHQNEFIGLLKLKTNWKKAMSPSDF